MAQFAVTDALAKISQEMGEQELAYTSMIAFVKKIEKDWQIDSSNIEYELSVEKSSIPYRGN